MYKNKCALALDMNRNVIGGSREELRSRIRGGADLRIYTEFRHNEHIDTSAVDNQMIREVSDFPCTYLVDDRWVAAIMTLRQPVTLPDRFGARASMSFFMYNEDGRQACARPYLDGHGYDEDIGTPPPEMFGGGGEWKPMIHMHEGESYAEGTNGPSTNFIYDFYSYKFLVSDDWEEVLAHDKDGNVISGSADELDKASSAGCNIKVAIEGICDTLAGEPCIRHEVMIETGPHYYYSETGFMVAETRPFVRVVPEIPMYYRDNNWDFGWAIVRSDGHVAGLFYDPKTLKIKRTYERHAMRWFIKR